MLQSYYLRMPPSFTAVETFVMSHRPFFVLEAVEPLCGVKVELIPSNKVLQTEKMFHFLQLWPRILNQFICAAELK